MENIKLTQFSPGAGCGCKISPSELEEILVRVPAGKVDPLLLVGRESKDDAAVYDLGNGNAVISTTDFFTPIVDDSYIFGQIAACNALSDVYAMSGRPVMAISILGWPLDKLEKSLAGDVVRGASDICTKAGIVLAGGHSIDIPVPVFGLAVTGVIPTGHIRKNNTAVPGCKLLLSKPLGTGIISTAAKRGIVSQEHLDISIRQMTHLNNLGESIGGIAGVKAMTDVTGFGLLGHLLEICEGSKVQAILNFSAVPVIPGLENYIQQKAIPGGTYRNWKSYGHRISEVTEDQKLLLADPQTNGGLLIAVEPDSLEAVHEQAYLKGDTLYEIGEITSQEREVRLIRII